MRTVRRSAMNTLYAWAKRHNIPHAALSDLLDSLTAVIPSIAPAGTDEASAQAAVRLAASRRGDRLWRNNSGVLKDERGVPVRFGLFNESKKACGSIKSPDLVGIFRVLVTQDMVGSVIGQFAAREMKHPGWRFAGTAREIAQLKGITLINSMGGDAAFTTGALD